MSRSSARMVTGFNHNIKHKGRLFHVQTEDSGIENPHIITHVFIGGSIIASKKTSYADITHAENLPQLVRTLMEEQQKEMLRGVIHGAFDDPGAEAEAAVAEAGRWDQPKGRPSVAGKASAAPRAGSGGKHSPPKEGVAAPRESGDSFFGEDLIDERSLDEVILGFLTDDGSEK